MARSSYGKPSVNEGKKPVRRKKSTVTVEARKRKTSKTTVQEDSARTTVTVDAEKKKGDDSNKKKLLNEKAPLVRGFVETTLNLGVKGLIAEFRSKKRVLANEHMTEFMAQQANNRNRYKDVGCLDKTRVKLVLGPVEYIHANYVSTPSNPKKFICTQAPVTNTCAEFWYMVVQEKSAVILMLCNIKERGAIKCANYFPSEMGASERFGDIAVVARRQYKFPFAPKSTKVKITVTEMEVTIKGMETPHFCNHYHWQDWPDRGVPEADMAPIALLNSLKDNGKPIIVHCSAGIGRTGSMVLIQHILELLKENAPVEALVGYMDELRKQRHNSVQTEHQYLYVHQVMLIYFNRTGFLDESAKKRFLETFTKDYEKATAAFN